MSSYLIDPHSVHHGRAVVTGEEARHAIKVARRRPGERIWLIDGQGIAYEARVRALGHDRVECEVLRRIPEWGEPQVRVTLAAALVKGDRFETLVEKAVELGVNNIWPVETAFSVVRNPSEHRRRRWEMIARAATKQCQRSRIPTIAAPMSLEELIARMDQFDAAFVAWESEQADRLGTHESLGGNLLVVIGPEGGFTETEIARLRQAGARTITLGSRRLRAETAAICALSLVMDRAGELAPPAQR